MAPDSEWQLSAECAKTARAPITWCVVQRLMGPPRPLQKRLPLEPRRQAARHVLVLGKLEKLTKSCGPDHVPTGGIQ